MARAKTVVNTGDCYGLRTVLKETTDAGEKHRTFLTRCRCGSLDVVRLDRLRSGNANACRVCAHRLQIVPGSRRNHWVCISGPLNDHGPLRYTWRCHCGAERADTPFNMQRHIGCRACNLRVQRARAEEMCKQRLAGMKVTDIAAHHGVTPDCVYKNTRSLGL